MLSYEMSRKASRLPIASYTHSGNTEIVVSAVDVDTDTFTSVAHGLANNDRLFAVMNYDAGNIYPADKFATGAITGYVVNKTDDTFQLSASSGGGAQNITTNANLDLTKWHFEKLPGNITISSLPDLTRCLLKIRGKTVAAGTAMVLVNNLTSASEYAKTGSTTYVTSALSISGDISLYAEILIDYTRYLKILAKAQTISNNTASAYTTATVDKMAVSPKYAEGTIQSITLSAWYPANGFSVEVFRV